MDNIRWVRLATGLLAAGLAGALLTACGGDDKKDDDPTPTPEVISFEQDGIVIRDPWVRATIPAADDATPAAESATTTAAFMIIENTTGQPQRLVSASVSPEIAAMVEIHETVMGDNDVMQMQPVDGVDVPAGGTAELKPRGLHIMLMNVRIALNEGDLVPLTLTFESGLVVEVQATVRPLTS